MTTDLASTSVPLEAHRILSLDGGGAKDFYTLGGSQRDRDDAGAASS